MIKFFYRSLIISFLISISLLSYLSLVGIETNKFNSKISNLIKNFNNDLDIDLKEVKIVLDPFNLKIKAKTIGSKLKIKGKVIEIENIKTNISINSLLSNEFSITNLEISTKSLEIKNLASFLRNLENTPELYVLEKIVKKGYIIFNAKLEFEKDGKIKNNYKVNGILKDGKIAFSKKFYIDNLDFIFNFDNEKYQFNNIKLSLNNIPLKLDQVAIKEKKKDLIVNGTLENQDVLLKDEIIKIIKDSFNSNVEVKNINFSSKNNFSFRLNKKFKILDFKLSSKIQLNNLSFYNNFELNDIFPNFKKEININDNVISLEYYKNTLSLKGKGKILFQNNEEDIKYKIVKKDKSYNFNTTFSFEKNSMQIPYIGYQKDKDVKSTLNLKGKSTANKKTIINSASIIENSNKLEIRNLVLDKNFKITGFKQIKLAYLDKDKKENQLDIVNKDNDYYLKGSNFNSNFLIQRLITNDNKKELDLLNRDFKLNIVIDKVYIDEKHEVNGLVGNLTFIKNKISEGVLNASFSNKEKLNFTVNSNEDGKVTTFFLGRAEPIIKRYKFIKGFENGSLDFYSLDKGGNSSSTLKIYDFNLKQVPILTKILTLASLQGIADILSGEGITFTEFEMNYRNVKNEMIIDEVYAIGPAISILMDGYLVKNKLISLSGTLVPATTINKFVGSIPVLGKILVGTKTGEGVFGVSFKIKGQPKNLKTTVNPIKTLTPRFITRTLEKIKKN